MARRVSWTNNSSGHLGTRIYRAPTLDPQNLPAPVATVAPVAQGATAEWVDTSGEYGCYAVQDFDGQGVSALSGEVCVTDPLDSAQAGDEIEGGIYAGIINYSDGRSFHIIAAKSFSQPLDRRWDAAGSPAYLGVNDLDDGAANSDVVRAHIATTQSGYEQYYMWEVVANYNSGGHADWYVPASNELQLVFDNLSGHGDLSSIFSDGYVWTSTERTSDADKVYVGVVSSLSVLTSGSSYTFSKDNDHSSYKTLPVRRVPV